MENIVGEDAHLGELKHRLCSITPLSLLLQLFISGVIDSRRASRSAMDIWNTVSGFNITLTMTFVFADDDNICALINLRAFFTFSTLTLWYCNERFISQGKVVAFLRRDGH